MTESLAELIDAILPQTQCTQCGFSGCMPYAQALSEGRAEINLCPPGGEAGMKKLAVLLNVEEKPLSSDYAPEMARKVAFIVEEDCIGCSKCLLPCPIDAILGANKQMHTVISSECSGCELCVAPCPVDCIIMQQPADLPPWNQAAANHARQRYHSKIQRLQQQSQEKNERLRKQKQLLTRLKV